MCVRVARSAAIGLILAVVTASAPAFAQIAPRVLSPFVDTDYVFGLQVALTAHDQNGLCAAAAEDYEWFFREQGDPWPASGYFFDDPDRLLANRVIPFGCDLAPVPGDACLVDGKKRYEVKVRMCGVDSPTIAFAIVYAPLPADPPHPSFPPDDGEPLPDPPNDGNYCFVDWGPVDTNGVQDHAATEHFNVFWPATYSLCDPSITLNPPQPVLPPPTAARLGLMECIYAVLDADMVSPLSPASIYRNAPAYAGITKLPLITGKAVTGGGGGDGEIQGMSHGPGANAPSTDRVAIHELFHVFDYAGNPLHYRNRDYRYEANPFHFYHEATAVVEQAMSSSAPNPWGYRWDRWPAWIPLDLGLTELDYDAAPFWAYVLGRYGFTPRRSLRGPAIDACAAYAQSDSLGNELEPHRYKFFEEWNAITRADVSIVEPVLRNYVSGQCPVESHYGPLWSGAEADSPLNNGALYTGMVDPVCMQTLEYDLSVVEDLARANAGAWAGTELAESIQLDFAVDFAKRFSPLSLLTGIPDGIVCALAGLQRSSGFDATPSGCLKGGSEDGSFPGIRADAPICAGVNPHDFWARIEFRVTTASPRWMRVLANDDATVFVDGTAVIDGADPFGRANYAGFPPASATYADQRYQWPENHAPRTSLFRVGDARSHRYEVEWVNRGDGRGNADYDCDSQRSRYLLQLEGYDTTPAALAPVPAANIQIVRAEFWGGQGSGYPPGGPAGATIPPDYKNLAAPLAREIQLRPVGGGGSRPFLLPPLAAHYHPVACPTGYSGGFEVSVRDDFLTETRPSVHLLALKAPDTVEWRGAVPVRDADERSVTLTCDGASEVARDGGDPAFLAVSTARTLHGPADSFGTLGAVHYTVLAGNPGADTDGDGVADYRDNCPYQSNPSQADGGRLGSLLPDWVGTSCQCGDVTNDGAVLPDDVTALRNWLARATPSLPAGQKCNVIGPAGTSPTQDCDVRDMAVLLRSMTPDQLAPGPSPVCGPALP